jgi:DNA polymerase-3 subunit alpha
LSFDEFLGISDNVIKISACLASPLSKYSNNESLINIRVQNVIKEKEDRIKYINNLSEKDYYEKFKEGDERWYINPPSKEATIQKIIEKYDVIIHKLNNNTNKEYILNKLLQHYDYYEIQYHNIPEQIEYNKFLYDMSQKFNKPLIAGTDTHSIDSYKAECRTILQWGKTDGAWGDEENEFDLTYKSYDELIDLFKEQDSIPIDVVMDAINNTNIMADSCNDITIDTSVKYPICYGDKDEDVMWNTLRKNYMDKRNKGIINNDPQYIDNIKEEMRVFKKTNMIGFMLFMSEMATWCKDNNIPTSPCRGSVGGSTVAYISNIIDVDPIKWHTIFSRFCNEDRVEVGDIDMDFYEEDRPKVYDYIINRFGKEKTAYILANGTAVDKGTIDIIGKALHNKWRIKMGFAKNDKSHDSESPYSLSNVSKIKTLYSQSPQKARNEYKELFYYFDGVVNTVISQSQHPAGIVASPINLIDNCSAFVGEDNQAILPLDMDEVHEIGLVKYDILGLKNLGVIKKTCEYANIPYPKSYEIDWDDQKVYDDMVKSPIGIFQFEGDYAFSLLKKFGIHNINDMSIVNASLRPSGESYRDRLIAHKPNKNPSELIDKLLEPNHGYLLFQEDTIKFLQQICGLSGSEADNVRRAIGRKQTDRLQKALPQILEGYCNMSDKPRDVAEQEAKQFLQIIEDSSNYQFGYNHSTGYSMVGYLCAYMRYYHTTEFICAFLNCAKDDTDIHNGTLLAKERGIKIVNPQFRHSKSEYMCDPTTNTIYKGIGSIKSVGKDLGDELYSLRNNHYDNFISLLSNMSIKKNQLDILVHLNFFKEFGDVNSLLAQIDIYNKYHKSKSISKDKLTDLERECIKGCYEKETAKKFMGINNEQFIDNLIAKTPVIQSTDYDAMVWQIQLLGYTDTKIESASIHEYMVESIEVDQWGRPWADLYNIKCGVSKNIEINKRHYHGLEQGDIIKAIFGDKKIVKFMGKDDKGKNIYKDTGQTRRWVVNYNKIGE